MHVSIYSFKKLAMIHPLDFQCHNIFEIVVDHFLLDIHMTLIENSHSR